MRHSCPSFRTTAAVLRTVCCTQCRGRLAIETTPVAWLECDQRHLSPLAATGRMCPRQSEKESLIVHVVWTKIVLHGYRYPSNVPYSVVTALLCIRYGRTATTGSQCNHTGGDSRSPRAKKATSGVQLAGIYQALATGPPPTETQLVKRRHKCTAAVDPIPPHPCSTLQQNKKKHAGG